jgi:glycerophosphoryl diester phosphodiesterase
MRLKSVLIRGGVIVALALLGINTTFLAPNPKGSFKMVAHRGVYHLYDRTNLGRDDCTATRIFKPTHSIMENTIVSMQSADGLGADMVEVDVSPTKDGKMVLFHDWTVDCRSNGKGETRDLTLAQLKALDIGYGYTADGGKTFPLRGKGVGKMPTVEEALAAMPGRPLMFNFKSKDASEADMLAAILKKAGRDSAKIGDGFYGGQAPTDRIRQLVPGTWTWTKSEVKRCTKDYLIYGWTSIVPESCRGKTLVVPVNMQWAYWGWPNRLIARMESVGATVMIVGPYGEDESKPMGVTTPDEVGSIPSSFNGIIWADDIAAVGNAIRR